jgi:hypothetical protein
MDPEVLERLEWIELRHATTDASQVYSRSFTEIIFSSVTARVSKPLTITEFSGWVPFRLSKFGRVVPV